MSVEFFSPVSGKILQVNNGIFLDLTVIKNDPYVKGWFLTIELSNPGEWDDLLSPQEYTDFNAKVL
jgi:glycine cleavage system H protein